MRIFIILLLVSTVAKVFGQTDFNSLLQNVRTINLPYKTEGLENIVREKKILNSSDSIFIVTKLNSKNARTINPYGISTFGQIDCENPSDCQKLKNIKEIAILWFIKVAADSYILHLEFEENAQFGMRFGALVSINKNGELIDWFFSNGTANEGNPHGNVTRDFTIQNDMTILIDETSWGDNTTTYKFKAEFKITSRAYENNSDYRKGEFQLKSLCINY